MQKFFTISLNDTPLSPTTTAPPGAHGRYTSPARGGKKTRVRERACCDVRAERGPAFEARSSPIGRLLEAPAQLTQSRPYDAGTRFPNGPGIAMETPGASPRALLLPTASGPRRKRATEEAGTAIGKQRVLDEEEYIEVRPWCGRQRLLGPYLASPSSCVPPLRPWQSHPLAEVERPESLTLGCGQSESQISTMQKGVFLVGEALAVLPRQRGAGFVYMW